MESFPILSKYGLYRGEVLLDVGTAHLVSNFDIENGEKWLARAAEFRLIAENRAKFAATPRKLDRSACKGILMSEMFEGYLAVLVISIVGIRCRNANVFLPERSSFPHRHRQYGSHRR